MVTDPKWLELVKTALFGLFSSSFLSLFGTFRHFLEVLTVQGARRRDLRGPGNTRFSEKTETVILRVAERQAPAALFSTFLIKVTS